MRVEDVVCDKCYRSADGDSPDSVHFLSCGHDVCNEHFGGGMCPVCKRPATIGRAVLVVDDPIPVNPPPQSEVDRWFQEVMLWLASG